MLRHFRTVAVLQPGDAFLPVAHQLRVHALAAHALSSGNLGRAMLETCGSAGNGVYLPGDRVAESSHS